jgi:hypothetical protein
MEKLVLRFRLKDVTVINEDSLGYYMPNADGEERYCRCNMAGLISAIEHGLYPLNAIEINGIVWPYKEFVDYETF